MFIFRTLNYLTTALCVCVCYCLSGSQGNVARCLLHITEFTKRAVCTERNQSLKDGEYLNRLEGKGGKKQEFKNSTKQNLIIRI